MNSRVSGPLHPKPGTQGFSHQHTNMPRCENVRRMNIHHLPGSLRRHLPAVPPRLPCHLSRLLPRHLPLHLPRHLLRLLL